MIYSFKARDLRSRLEFDIELVKDKRVYCFLGENGVGKTRLLENLAKALFFTHMRFRKRVGDAEHGDFIPFFMNDIDLNRFNNENAVEMKLNESKIWCRKIRDELLTLSGRSTRETFVVSTTEGTDYYHNFPICFISAANRGYTKNLNTNPELLSDNKTIFEKAIVASLTSMNFAAEFTSGTINNRSLADWIATRTIINPETVSFDSRRALAEVDLLFNILSPLMPKELCFFDRNGAKKVRYEPKTLYVADTPIDKLPTGVISLMHIIQEIISCYSAWNGVVNDKEKIEDIQQTEGIVFIDEIEAHMHPKWQARIIPLLKESFPKTTFYIATHSPAIVATTDNDEAYMLNRDGDDVTEQILGNPRDWYLEEIFSAGFDVKLPQGKQETIEDRILAFSKLANRIVREIDEDNKVKLKHEFIEKHNELTAQFEKMPNSAKDDPRRNAVEQIWENVQ